MVALSSVIFKIKFSTSGVAHGDALLREELPQKNVFFRALPGKGGGEVIRAIPRRKHFFLQELFPKGRLSGMCGSAIFSAGRGGAKVKIHLFSQ